MRLFSGYEGFELVVFSFGFEHDPVLLVDGEYALDAAAAAGIEKIDLVRRNVFLIHVFVVLLFFCWCDFSDDEFLAPFPGYPISQADGDDIVSMKFNGHFDFHRVTSVLVLVILSPMIKERFFR
jgi:hypothetical protein